MLLFLTFLTISSRWSITYAFILSHPETELNVCLAMFLLFLPGGYKGYGLGMMVEVFCGILAGSQYSKHIRTWKVTDRIANLVCLFFASFTVRLL